MYIFGYYHKTEIVLTCFFQNIYLPQRNVQCIKKTEWKSIDLCPEMTYLKYFCSYIFRIYLVGQSAGAHIAACALLNQAIGECGEGDTSSWSVSQLKAYFGISGG